MALVQGPDNKTYLVRVNDRLADGNVRAVTADTLVLMQDVNDPLSATKQREVRKTLRAAGGAEMNTERYARDVQGESGPLLAGARGVAVRTGW